MAGKLWPRKGCCVLGYGCRPKKTRPPGRFWPKPSRNHDLLPRLKNFLRPYAQVGRWVMIFQVGFSHLHLNQESSHRSVLPSSPSMLTLTCLILPLFLLPLHAPRRPPGPASAPTAGSPRYCVLYCIPASRCSARPTSARPTYRRCTAYV